MKILKSGRGPTPWSAEYVCTGGGFGCGARLLVGCDDVFVLWFGPRHDSIGRAAFECPECGHATTIADPPFLDPYYGVNRLPSHSVWLERKDK